MKRATLVLVAAALLFGGMGQARADFVSFGTAQVFGEIDNNTTTYDSGLASGFPSLSIPISATGQGAEKGQSVAGQAYVRFVTLPGLSQGFTWELQTAAQGSDPFGYPQSMDSFAISRATWQDVLTLGNTDPLLVGHTLRLNFRSSGIFTGTSSVDQNVGAADWTGIAEGNQGTILDAPYGPNAGVTVGFNNGIVGGDYRMDSFTLLGGGGYTDTWHLDIPIAAGQGNSFVYRVLDQIRLWPGANVTESGADPSGFLSITLPDVGNVTPESLGVSITFASGIASPNLQPSATAAPEPASLTLLGLGAAGLLGYGWRRRKAKA